MDKQQQNLDPKLKEIYERVMGTNVASAPPPQTQAVPQAPAPITAPVAQAAPLPTTTPTPVVSPPPAQPAAPAPAANQTHVQQKTAKGTTTFVAQQGSSSKTVLPILYLIGGIIFLLVYTIFWMRVFGIPVPYFQ